MDEQGCPRCKTTKYRNPSLKLLVNVCGHSLCESCVDLLFIKGSGVCPECNTALRRNNFRLQLFEDAYVEKEVDIRKKLLKDFNKKEEDFPSLRDYNDYLEQLESIVFNLANNIDVDATRKLVDQYKKENRDVIQKNKTKMSRDEEFLDRLIAQEQEEVRHHRQTTLEDEVRERTFKKKNKESLIDDLMFSDLPASAIMAEHQRETEKAQIASTIPKAATGFSTGIKVGYSQDGFIPVPADTEEEAYHYAPVVMEMCGPSAPQKQDLKQKGYMENIRAASLQEKSGGYDASMACHRALLDAMAGLFHFQDPSQSAVSATS